jgi:putative ABC transport system permease protein
MDRPPWFAERLLAIAIRDRDRRDMILGDLHEEYVARARTQRSATRWYFAQAFALVTHALTRRQATPGTNAVSGDSLMNSLVMDLKYGVRSLRKRPAVTAVIALTLALGLGANAAVFNLIDGLVLRPYPLPDPDRMVMLSETGPGIEYRRGAVSPANFLDWRDQARTLSQLSAFDWWDANLITKQEPERLQASHVSFAFFDAIGLQPALGRSFVRDDETAGRHRVVVISDNLWKRHFAADRSIIGASITIDGELHTVVGVAPPRFNFPFGTDLWAPLSFERAKAPRDVHFLTVIGRLAPGRTVHEAQNEMGLIATRLAQEFPKSNKDHGAQVFLFRDGMADEGTGPILSLWQASAVFVLLIACANIANLLLARSAERRREIALRFALGAGRGRVIRELLLESSLLALIAVPLALAFAWAGVHAIRISMPARITRFVPGWEDLGVNGRMAAFTLVLALATAIVFGLLPALQAARSRVIEALKEGGRTSTAGRHRLRRGLVVAEISLTLPLLVAAGLGVLGTNRLLNGPQGYDPDGLLVMKLVLPERTYPTDAAQRQFVTRSLELLSAVPGVERTAVVNSMPAGGSNDTRSIDIDGHPPADPTIPINVDWRDVTPEYFSAMRLPIREGRAFTDADREDASPVAIVSESMARKFWPGENPLGRRVRLRNGAWATTVGVCGDVIHDWFGRRNAPTMYRPFAQAPSREFAIAVRTAGDPASLATPVRRALLDVDPVQPVFELMTMRTALWERMTGLRYLSAVMTVFAAVALILAIVGLYAVMAYIVSQRTHEIGVRIALGASRGDVVRLTVGHAAQLTVVGAATGLALSAGLSRLMQAGMLDIASNDARVSFGFTAVLVASALLAGYVPARRAAAVDPIAALRSE